jgi:hypothetical protein
LGPFLNGDLSRMPKLIQIVLQTPMLPLLQGIVDADLICTAMAAEYSTISPSGLQKIDLARRITRIITSHQRYTAWPPQITERNRSIRDLREFVIRNVYPSVYNFSSAPLYMQPSALAGELSMIEDNMCHPHPQGPLNTRIAPGFPDITA